MKKIDAQVRPAAVALNTSGMNTMVLKAVDQRMRSVSTAKTSPKKVTRNGNDHHPDDVVLQRDDDVGRREDRLVVAEPDEVLAAAVEQASDHRGDQRVDDDQEQPERSWQQKQERSEVTAKPATAARRLARRREDLPTGSVGTDSLAVGTATATLRPSPQWSEILRLRTCYRNAGARAAADITHWYENGSEVVAFRVQVEYTDALRTGLGRRAG